MTLRVRLLLGLIVLSAVGLVVTGAVTYRETSGDLLSRVNRQLTYASSSPQLFFRDFRGNPAPTVTGALLPPGTWVQVRAVSTGEILDTKVGLTGESPTLPRVVKPGTTFTVNEPHYRVRVAQPTSFGIPNADGTTSVIQATLIVGIPLADVDHTLHHLLVVEAIVTLGVLVGLALLAWWMIKFGLRPLESMQKTAVAIAAGDLSQRVDIVDENTEVGRLGVALNDMMQQIETAFDARAASEGRLRRFIGDASHELRTPLTSIRGYAELFRRGAADRPEDLAKAMRRIEEEANRMGLLVDDMLLLARLDQGRSLEHQPVDLVHLSRDAVDDARAVAPDRPIDFTPSTPVFVPGDEARIRQVLGNLLQNANRHTPPDTPVHVRVIGDETEAAIEVADEGPGMSAENASHVFERFWRSDPARTRSSGGAGLGLAIVSAIAASHGGRAEVTSEIGKGSTFRVYFPLQTPLTEVPPSEVPASDRPPSDSPSNESPPNESPPSVVPVAEIDEA